MIYYKWLESPVGDLLLTAVSQLLTGLYLKDQKHFPDISEGWQEVSKKEIFDQAEEQLSEYFSHKRQRFDIAIAPQGTPFQQQVWHHLYQIPFGKTTSYGSLAEVIGKPGAARAVGAANGRNPISIIVPCHRVIAINGNITGYAGGIDRKHWLLRHEQESGAVM